MSRRLRVAALLAGAALGGACVVPNVVLPVNAAADGVGQLDLPQRAEWVELALPTGESLRGFWAPADAGAPVVLQLMEATVGASQPGVLHRIAWQLPDAGYSVLALDYRGVAASDGARSTEQVRADARAMWREAVRRAGGDERRVVLRGGSLGALAAATLLQDGARPGAVVLYGPVRSQSVARHFLTTGWAGVPQLPDWAAAWVAMLIRQPLAVDVGREIARSPAPVMLICGGRDELLPPREVELLRRAWSGSPHGGLFVLEDEDHVGVCTKRHALDAAEAGFLRRALPPRPDPAARAAAWSAALDGEARARLDAAPDLRAQFDALAAERFSDPPRVAAALLLAGHEPGAVRQILEAERLRRGRWLTPLAPARIAAVTDLRDAADPLPLAGLLSASLLLAEIWPRPIGAVQLELDSATGPPLIRLLIGPNATFSAVSPRAAELLAVAGGATPAETHRRAQRLLMMAAGLPASAAPDLQPLRGDAADAAALRRALWEAAAP